MMPTSIVTLAVLATSLALATGCGLSDETGQPASRSAQEPAGAAEPAVGTQPGVTMAQVRDSCPSMVEGGTVEVSDTEVGVALTFTTSGDVDDLRARGRLLGKMYEMHGGHRGMMWHQMGRMVPSEAHAAGQMEGHGMGSGADMGMEGHGMGSRAGVDMGGGTMPSATATVEDVDGGSRILLVPTNASQLEALRVHARMHLERMHAGGCPMLNPARE